MQGVLILCWDSAGLMIDIEPSHAGLAGGQLLVVRAHNGGNVGLTGSRLVCVLLCDLVGDVDHGGEGGKGGVGMIPTHNPALVAHWIMYMTDTYYIIIVHLRMHGFIIMHHDQ